MNVEGHGDFLVTHSSNSLLMVVPAFGSALYEMATTKILLELTDSEVIYLSMLGVDAGLKVSMQEC